MSYSPEAFVAELRTVLENVQTELSATGRNSARIQRCIDAMPSLAATLRQQAARVDEDAIRAQLLRIAAANQQSALTLGQEGLRGQCIETSKELHAITRALAGEKAEG